MENMSPKVKKKLSECVLSQKQVYILLAVIIILQILNVTYYFAFRKEGFHSDEMWSYGFANSFFEPYMYSNVDGSPAMGVWRDGTDFEEYITVQPGEQFRFDSVWYNEVPDMHPPLYPAILHLICSFFPNVFSKYFAYLINIIAMAVGQVYLYRTALRLCKSDFLGVITCIFWGFCNGFVNLNIYLRAYPLITMLSIMLMFYHTRLYLSEGSFTGNLIKIGLIIIAGALSHHYFLVLSFIIVACFCFFYLFKRQWKNMFIYAFSMLGSVLLSFAAFPAAISHLFQFGSEETRLNNNMPLLHGIRYTFGLIQEAYSGYRISAYATSWYSYIVVALVSIIALAVPLCFLFRNEVWFKKFAGKVKDGIISFGRNFDFMLLFIVISVFFVLGVVSYNVNLNSMADLSDRYIFFVMPWAGVAAVLICKHICKAIKPLYNAHKYNIIAWLCCTLLAFSSSMCPIKYLFESCQYGRGIASTVNENSRYIMVMESEWVLTSYPYKLMGCNSFFPTSVATYKQSIEEIGNITPDNDTYLLLDTSVLDAYSAFLEGEKDEDGNVENGTVKYVYEDDKFKEKIVTEQDVIDIFEKDIFPGYKMQFNCSEYVFGRMIHTFNIVPEEDYTDVPINDFVMEYKEMQKELKEKEFKSEEDALKKQEEKLKEKENLLKEEEQELKEKQEELKEKIEKAEKEEAEKAEQKSEKKSVSVSE